MSRAGRPPQCVTVAFVMPQMPVRCTAHPPAHLHHLILRVRNGRLPRLSVHPHSRLRVEAGAKKQTLTSAPGQAAARAELDHLQVAIGQLLRRELARPNESNTPKI